MSLVALLLLRFDLKPATKDGKWQEPRKTTPMTSSMPTPTDEMKSHIVPRDDRKWRVSFSVKSKGVDIVAEDIIKDSH